VLRLSESSIALGLVHPGSHGFPKRFSFGAGWAVRGESEVGVQIRQKRRVILPALVDVRKEEVGLWKIGVGAERFANDLLGFVQAVQTKECFAQIILRTPRVRIEIQAFAKDLLRFRKPFVVVENRPESDERMRVLAAADFYRLPKRLLRVRNAPQIEVRYSYPVIGLEVSGIFGDRALEEWQAAGCIFFCLALQTLPESVKSLRWNVKFPDGNLVFR